MKYLKAYTAKMRQAPFTEADPHELGVWLLLAMYCAEHENGGRIAGIKSLSDRALLRSIGITHAELEENSNMLWRIDGNELVVEGYSVTDEQSYIAKRSAGRRGGEQKASNRKQQLACAKVDARPIANAHAPADALPIKHNTTPPNKTKPNLTLHDPPGKPPPRQASPPLSGIDGLDKLIEGAFASHGEGCVCGWSKLDFVREVQTHGVSESDALSAWDLYAKNHGRDLQRREIKDIGVWARKLIDGRKRVIRSG